MKNIIKSEFLRLKKDKLCRIIFFFFLVAGSVLSLETQLYVYMSDMSGGENVLMSIAMVSFAVQFFLYIYVSYICGTDFRDKTCNYQIMAGHTRAEVYFGKVIMFISAAVILSAVLSAVYIFTIILYSGGWGDTVKISDMLIRMVLFFFCIIRIICVLIFMTFIFKNQYAVVITGFISNFLFNIYADTNERNYYILGTLNIKELCKFDFWTSFGINGDLHFVYDIALSSELITGTIFSSVIVSGAALILGYAFFKYDDMH